MTALFDRRTLWAPQVLHRAPLSEVFPPSPRGGEGASGSAGTPKEAHWGFRQKFPWKPATPGEATSLKD